MDFVPRKAGTMANFRKRRRKKVGVYLVANHPLAARYLMKLLARKADVEVVTDLKDLASHHVLRGASPVSVIDTYALPCPLGVYLRAVGWAFKDPRILVIGGRLSDDGLCRLLFQGVSGFVPYDEAAQQICAAIDAVLSGHIWAPPSVLERYVVLSSALATQKCCERGALSPRESEIVALLERRLSNKEIGDALGVSERTVRFHLQNVFDKLGVRDRHSVAELARSSGLVASGNAEGARPPGRERQPTGLQNLPAAA
jgi:DNA-binding NarL/FixJ family response regulator